MADAKQVELNEVAVAPEPAAKAEPASPAAAKAGSSGEYTCAARPCR